MFDQGNHNTSWQRWIAIWSPSDAQRILSELCAHNAGYRRDSCHEGCHSVSALTSYQTIPSYLIRKNETILAESGVAKGHTGEPDKVDRAYYLEAKRR